MLLISSPIGLSTMKLHLRQISHGAFYKLILLAAQPGVEDVLLSFGHLWQTFYIPGGFLDLADFDVEKDGLPFALDVHGDGIADALGISFAELCGPVCLARVDVADAEQTVADLRARCFRRAARSQTD